LWTITLALQSLNLSFTVVADLEPLKALTALQSLNLSGTKAADLAPVQDLPNLESITVLPDLGLGLPNLGLERLNNYRAGKGLPPVRAVPKP
jgi:hypothetical protein